MVPSKGALLPGSPHTAPIERDAPFIECSCTLKAPVNELPSRFPNEEGYPFQEPSFTYS